MPRMRKAENKDMSKDMSKFKKPTSRDWNKKGSKNGLATGEISYKYRLIGKRSRNPGNKLRGMAECGGGGNNTWAHFGSTPNYK